MIIFVSLLVLFSHQLYLYLFIDYTDALLSLKIDKDDYGLPPFTTLVKPLTMLYSGKMGRNYRRIISQRLKQHNSSSPEAFRSVVLGAINDCKLIS